MLATQAIINRVFNAVSNILNVAETNSPDIKTSTLAIQATTDKLAPGINAGGSLNVIIESSDTVNTYDTDPGIAVPCPSHAILYKVDANTAMGYSGWTPMDGLFSINGIDPNAPIFIAGTVTGAAGGGTILITMQFSADDDPATAVAWSSVIPDLTLSVADTIGATQIFAITAALSDEQKAAALIQYKVDITAGSIAHARAYLVGKGARLARSI